MLSVLLVNIHIYIGVIRQQTINSGRSPFSPTYIQMSLGNVAALLF